MHLVNRSEDFRRPGEPPIRIGDIVELNSGGPPMLVVDVDNRIITVGWRDGELIREGWLPEPCVHRCRKLW